MTALLKKDWGVYRMIVAGGAAILLMVYAIGLSSLARLDNNNVSRDSTANRLAQIATGGIGATALLSGVFGAASFAPERRERSAEFLAILPITRRQIIASKVIVVVACIGAMWLVNLAVLLPATVHTESFLRAPDDFWRMLMALMAATVSLFGVAWLLSTFIPNSAIAMAISVALVMASASILRQITDNLGLGGEVFVDVWSGWMFLVGIVSFIAGIIHYLQRIEP